MYRILLIDDDRANRESASAALSAMGHDVVSVDPSAAMGLFDNNEFDIVVAGIEPASESVSRVHVPQTLVYLPRPFTPADAVNAVSSVERRDAARRASVDARSPRHSVIGQSASMRAALDRADAVADSDAPVLLTGESGTGKDILARTIHAKSARHHKPFVAINCAAFPETLLEAELFGYERGAFTGALQRREGRFRAADGGTLFLDEVNGLSLAAQAKLLRVLEDGTFQPIGTNTTHEVNVRLISATNCELRTLVAERTFREDLYYRVKVLDIVLPPLRERIGDLPLLVNHFLIKYAPGDSEPGGLSPPAWAALSQHAFPGNVRELEHAIQHALVLARGAEIDIEHLPCDIAPPAEWSTPPSSGAQRSLSIALREFEREFVLGVLRAAGGNKTRAAQLLGISRKNLWEKLTKSNQARVEAKPGDGYEH